MQATNHLDTQRHTVLRDAELAWPFASTLTNEKPQPDRRT